MTDLYWVKRFDPGRLKSVRISRSMSQQELAQRSGQARETIVKYENGTRAPRASTVARLASALEVDVAELASSGPVDLPLLRARQGLSQGDVAAALNISRAWFQRIEALDAAISREQLERLAHKLQADDSLVETLVRVHD